MGNFADVASGAIDLIRGAGMSPPDAWQAAAALVFPHSRSSRTECCPKGAFLGLCRAGLIRDVPRSDYGRSATGKNANYAIAAAKLLREKVVSADIDEAALWRETLRQTGAELSKAPNGQMGVVVRIAQLGLLL